jgi:hypothetical protein
MRPSRTLPAVTGPTGRPSRKSGAVPKIIPEHPDDIVLDLSLDDYSDESLKRQAIADVVDHAVRMTRALELARPMESWPWRPLILASLASLTLLFTLTTFLAFPDWVFGASPALMSAQRREASTRMAMYLTAERLLSYQDARGSLPVSLTDVGDSWTGGDINYSTFGGSFLLTSRVGNQTLALRSEDDRRAFLGLSPRYLRERP